MREIRPSTMAPVGVYAFVDIPTDPTALRIRPAAQTLLAGVAESIRADFGAQDKDLGWGEPRVAWEGVAGGLRVIAHRDGRLTWKDPEGDSLTTSAIRAVSAKLRVLHDSGGRLAWPDSLAADSTHFTISLHTPIFDRSGSISSPKLDRPEPLFRVMQPSIELALAIAGRGGPRYPDHAKRAGVHAVLTFSLVVDTSGRAEPATVKDLWPHDEPRLTGKEAKYYEAFVESVRKHLVTSARFLPARIGGCPVRASVTQRFEFRIHR